MRKTMRNRRGKSQQQGQTIDLTPMLDVVFIMLIFFIVTATFIKLPGPEVNKLDTETECAYKKVGILVAVTESMNSGLIKSGLNPLL